MKFFCLLLAIGFFFAVKADEAGLDQEEIPKPGETLEGLPELQDQDEALQGIQDGAPQKPGTIAQKGFTQCGRRKGDCYLLTCPRGTVTMGSCDFFYRCCKRK